MRRQAVEDKIRTHFYEFFTRESQRLVEHIASKLRKDASDDVNETLSSYDWSSWQIAIEAALPLLTETFLIGANDVSSFLAVDLLAGTDPRAIEYARERAGSLIGAGKNPEYALDGSTRKMLHDTLVQQFEQGAQSIQDLAAVIQNDYAFSESRATTIARTETGTAYNIGAIARYRDVGIPKVQVFDGVDYDDECANADGQIWDLDYAEEHPLQHPNCHRAFSGIFEDDNQEVDES